MTGFSLIHPVSLREQVAAQIRTAIIEGRLKPNDHIVEATLTQQFGVSRTPVREALILLESEALIVSVPNRGCFVRVFNEDDVVALFSMRTTLENFAAELISNRLTADDFAELDRLIEAQHQYILQDDFKRVRSTDMTFHQYLIDASDHPILKRTWQAIVAQIAAVLYLRAEANPDVDEFQAITDHRSIVAALKEGNLPQLRAENERINDRVANQCISAVNALHQNR